MKKRALILCTGNSCRSQMAEALINARLGERWQAFSAGTRPAAQVNPYAIQVLAEIGVAVAGAAHPKHLSGFSGQPFDLVITVCDDAAENCPLWLGQGRRDHLGFPDPAAATGTAADIVAVYRAVRDDIERRLLPVLADF